MNIRSKTSKAIFFLGILIFLSISLFGVFHMGMDMKADGSMGDCPFAPNGSVCTMTPLEHIGALQNIFTTLPGQKSSLLFLMLLLAVSLSLIGDFLVRLFSPPLLFARRFSSGFSYISPHGLQEAYSSGILNPKIF